MIHRIGLHIRNANPPERDRTGVLKDMVNIIIRHELALAEYQRKVKSTDGMLIKGQRASIWRDVLHSQ
jgi:hypothetical protein